MEEWKNQKYLDVEYLDKIVYDNNIACREYKAVKITYEIGDYNVKIYGLKKKELSNDESEDFGFYIELTKVEVLGKADDATLVDFNFFE